MAVTTAEAQRVGDYLVTRRIAAGACGEVWLGRHCNGTGDSVAIKVNNDPQYLRNLQKDWDALHGLRHPGIVQAVDFDPYADPPYLAMEYVPGSSLRPLIQERKLSVADAVAVLRQVLAALAHAHGMGIVHRDIKPENILVHEQALQDGFSQEGVVKVTDFGLGRIEQLTSNSIELSTSLSGEDAQHVVGTLAYMAPEQQEGQPADARADLYACGIVFFEMLTGRKPHGTDLPSKLNPSVPRHLDEAFQRAFGWLDERFASAEEFSEALNDPAAPPPVIPVPQPTSHAWPPSPGGRMVWTNSLGMSFARIDVGKFTMGPYMNFVRIDAGTFMMGTSPDGEHGRNSHETQHVVTVAKPYYIGTLHVTRGQFTRFVAETRYQTDAEKKGHVWVYSQKNGSEDLDGASWRHPGFAQADDHPVVLVSWNDAAAFAGWLGEKEGKKYRLPTEAEWEFSCLIDSNGAGPVNTCDSMNPARGSSDIHPIAWEWCSQVLSEGDSAANSQDHDELSVSRVVLGGSWSLRSALRNWFARDKRVYYIGFRLAFDG